MRARTMVISPIRKPVWDRMLRGGWPLLAAVLLLAGGCGDDGGSSAPSSVSSRVARNRPAQNKQPAAEEGALQFYTKVEDLIGPEEAARIRHRFLPEDFEPDVSGRGNRDPFRSYVVRLGGDEAKPSGKSPAASELCRDAVAKDKPLRDLRLVGIVLRGTRSYALFVDGQSNGHIVTNGDCLGSEQAQVSSVRAGFVSLDIIPESTQSQPAPEPQRRIIPLYPNELLVEDGER